jgi:SsrA-binding protein
MAKGQKRKASPGDVASNRQARFRYELLDNVEAGIVLLGTEVKALRTGGAQMRDSYATLTDGEVWLHNLHIPHYGPAARENHDPDRSRKLLLHRREIDRLVGRIRERGLTVVPTRIYFKGPHAKVEIALARGKDTHDKRESIREREQKREMDRAMGRRR